MKIYEHGKAYDLIVCGAGPAGVAAALSRHAALRYRWRPARRRGDRLFDVREAVLLGWPVPMLIGDRIPRHWVLLVNWSNRGFDCYEPSSGMIGHIPAANIRRAEIANMGFRRAFALVLPTRLAARPG